MSLSRVNSKYAHIARGSLPPNEDGEWWELTDDSRGGIPYYYQTKTGETVWERPNAFVIPLGILQARNWSPLYVSMPRLTVITRRTPRLLVGFLCDSPQALKTTVVFRLHETGKTAKLIDRQPRANVLLSGRRALHVFPWVIVHPSHATQRDAPSLPHIAREAGLPLRMALLFLRKLGT